MVRNQNARKISMHDDEFKPYIQGHCGKCGWYTCAYDDDMLMSCVHSMIPKVCPYCGYDMVLEIITKRLFHVEGTFHYTVYADSEVEAMNVPLDRVLKLDTTALECYEEKCR